MKRINVTIDEKMLERVDEFAKLHFISRSGLISIALDQYMLQAQARDVLSAVGNAMQKIADSGNVTDEQIKQLDKFNTFMEVLEGK